MPKSRSIVRFPSATAAKSEEYRQVRKAAYEHFRNTENTHLLCCISRVCSFYSSDNVDFNPLHKRLEAAVAEKFDDWPNTVKGFVEYRCGCYEESLQTLKTYDSLESLFFRTMALFKLGQTEAAQQLFSRAATIASQMDPRMPAIGPWEEQPIVYCWVQQLAHEAAGVLNLPYAVASPTDAPANER